MSPDEPIEHELLRNAVAAEVTVTSSEVSPTSTGDRYVRIEGRLGDDEESHVEWAAVGFIYAIGVLSFAAARPRGVSGMHFEEHDQWTAADLLRHLRYEHGRLVCNCSPRPVWPRTVMFCRLAGDAGAAGVSSGPGPG